MTIDIPVDAPQGVAHRIDAIGIVAAQVDAEFVLGDQGVGLGDENVDLVKVMMQGLGQFGLQIGG